MEYFNENLSIENIIRSRKPTKDEVYSALVDPDTQPDWDRDILERADNKDILEVKKRLERL